MKRAVHSVLTFISITLWSLSAISAGEPISREVGSSMSPGNLCVNGDLSQNQQLMTSFEQSNDALVQSFNLARTKQHPPVKVCAYPETPYKQLGLLENLIYKLRLKEIPNLIDIKVLHPEPTPPSVINRECLAAAMQRHPGRTGYTCDYPQTKAPSSELLKQTVPKKYGNATVSTGQCITNKYVDYMKFALDSAYDCLSPQDNPLDARALFKKFNAETGFNNTIAWNGGIGAPQLTTTAIKELVDDNAGNCTDILKEVANSDKKSCGPFKALAQNDLVSRPLIEPKNYCAWLSPGDGLARSLMYGTAYNRCMRDQYILPALARRSPTLAKNQDVVSALTAITYGRGGIKQAEVLMQKLRINKKSDPGTTLKSLNKLSPYLRENNAKMKEMYCLQKDLVPGSTPCDKLKLSAAEEAGDLCVSH